jgi:hypothetical protein
VVLDLEEMGIREAMSCYCGATWWMKLPPFPSMEGGDTAVDVGEANRRPSGNLPCRCASPAGYCAPSPDMAAGDMYAGFMGDSSSTCCCWRPFPYKKKVSSVML